MRLDRKKSYLPTIDKSPAIKITASNRPSVNVVAGRISRTLSLRRNLYRCRNRAVLIARFKSRQNNQITLTQI
jgi:hypothetical protein